MALGLRFVHQELSLCPNLRVFENFAIEQPDVIRGLRWKSARDRPRERGAGRHLSGEPHRPAREGRRAVAVAAADGRDRPGRQPPGHAGSSFSTSRPLRSARGKPSSFATISSAGAMTGLSFIFISHRLQESLDLADRITVMRNGRVAWAGDSGSISQPQLIELLGGGRQLEARGCAARRSRTGGGRRSVRSSAPASARGEPRGGSRRDPRAWRAWRASGQREVLRSVFDAPRGPGDAVSVGGRVAFVSGDRAAEGIFPLWSIDENIAVSTLGRLARWGLISPSRFGELTSGWFDRLKIRAESGERAGHLAQRRQSAEGGDRPRDGGGSGRASCSTTRRAASTSGPRPTSTNCSATWRRRGGRSLWYSSDDAEFAQCDRTLVMRDGGSSPSSSARTCRRRSG